MCSVSCARGQPAHRHGWPHLSGSPGLALLEAAVATGRAYLEADGGGRISLLHGATPPGLLEWVPGANGIQARVATRPAAAC